MSTTVKTFSSSQSFMPSVDGQAGSLRTFLKAGLADGAGAQTVTINVAGGVATITYPAAHQRQVHGVELIAGATGVGLGLNGEQRLLSIPSATKATFATSAPDGAATGTISARAAPAGWAELFSGTNKSAFKSLSVEASGGVFRLDDPTTTSARVRAYEQMSDVDTGVGQMPLDAQLNGGLFWSKSSSAGAAKRQAYLIADGRAFHYVVDPTGNGRFTIFSAGDAASWKSGDPWSFFVTGGHAEQSNVTTAPDGCNGYSGRATTRNGAFLARSHVGTGGSIAARRIGAHQNGTLADAYAGTTDYAVGGTYPNGPNNGLILTRVELIALGIRGTIPGLYHAVQDCGNAFVTGAVIDGTDDLAGRKLLAVRVGPPAGSQAAGTVFIDITGPWDR